MNNSIFKHRLRVLAGIVAAFLVSIAVLFALIDTAPDDDTSLFITQTEAFYPDSGEWESAALPRSWLRDPDHDSSLREVWYRLPLPAQAHQAGWTQLLMLRHMMNVEIWLDQHYLGSAGPVTEGTLQRNWNRPAMWKIPREWITGGDQMLYFRLHSEPDFGVMSPVIIGAPDYIESRYRLNYFLQIDLVKISLLTMLFIACLGLFTWIKIRQQHWLLIALMSASWSVPLTNVLLPSLPIDEFNFLRLAHFGTVLGAFSLLAFIYSYYLAVPISKLKWLGLIPAVHGIVLTMIPDSSVVVAGGAGQLLAQILFLILIIQLLRQPAQNKNNELEIYSIITGLLVMLLASAHDISLALSGSVERWRWDMFMSYITQPLMMIIISAYGIKSILDSVSELDRLNLHLKQRLQEAEHNIRDVFTEQETLERQIRLASERELVYRDLHDDLGARLLSLVLKSDHGLARDVARSALQDLRDIVSRVVSEEQELSAVLADSMAEHESRAAALKKPFIWELDNSLDNHLCPGRAMLNLRLLLRELIGNCLQQSDISSLTFAAACQSSGSRNIDDNNDGPELTISLCCETSAGQSLFPLPPLLRKRIDVMGADYEQLTQGACHGIRLRIHPGSANSTAI